MSAMTTPTFADADAALAKRDYEAALSILERIDVVGEDACYRRDIQAAACADRLGLHPLCEEYATRAHSYGDDMADPFALMARAQRRQGLATEAAATASSGARIHPTNPAIARELALALFDLGEYEAARGPAELATDTYRNDIELLMAYGHVWEPVNPDAAQWAFRLANKLNPGCEEAKFAYDSLLRPLRGAGRSSYRIETQPAVTAAYRTMLRRIRTVLPKAGKVAGISGLCCLLFHLFVARFMFPGAYWRVFLLYVASVVSIRVYVAVQISTFNRTLPRGVRLSFMRLCGRFPEFFSNAVTALYIASIVGFFLICIMIGIG